MDAVVGTLQSPGAIYAASKLSYFDKMKNESKRRVYLTEPCCPERVFYIFIRLTLEPIPNFSLFSFYTFTINF